MLRRSKLSRTLHTLLVAGVVAAALAPLQAQSDVAARAIRVSGRVSVLGDGGQLANQVALFEGQSVKPKQIILTGPDGYAQFQIADGSTFEVFQNARVTYRETYPSWKDLIQVWLGRIRVQIDHSRGENHKSVSTPTAVISVRGTVFDVEVEDADATTVVSVEEGLVGVVHRLQPGDEVRLRPGESIRVFPDQPLAAKAIDRSGMRQAALKAAQQTIIQVLIQQRQGGIGVPGGPGSTGGQGDKGKKPTGGTGSPGSPGAPGAPGPSN